MLHHDAAHFFFGQFLIEGFERKQLLCSESLLDKRSAVVIPRVGEKQWRDHGVDDRLIVKPFVDAGLSHLFSGADARDVCHVVVEGNWAEILEAAPSLAKRSKKGCLWANPSKNSQPNPSTKKRMVHWYFSQCPQTASTGSVAPPSPVNNF